MAHSKRNTSRPIFTSHERAMARAAWGSSTARLSRDSFLPFASCWLCLEPAIDPVACAHGDIFCRECALNNILAQKKEIKRAEKVREQEEREAREEQARRDAEAKERAIREFELTQAGLSIKRGSTGGEAREKTEIPGPAAAGGNEKTRQDNTPRTGEKRKFSLDPDEVARIAEEERAKARKAMDDEKASKPTLPSFWTPSVTPSSKSTTTLHEVKKKVKTQPTCPASPEDNPHSYSLHTLISINFTEEPDSNTIKPQRICPACQKGLSNSSRATLAKACGHVLCKSCVDQFMKPSGSDSLHCYVCDSDLADKTHPPKKEGKGVKERIRPGLVELRREGTGFSAGGSNQVKKDTVTFQC
ncbi:ENOS interacting protein [Parathielavia appendiculata]|uniref:ENOS interacting protein n=1 Tax=Parathielavia appendiculata TaxID=2587402 RepID=A0AAN6Z3D8_9PEZI|nr:ENOS interacting protein [Parathielavia appendiculata]